MTPAERIAWHRAEADRIEAEEKAARPALAAGQVWGCADHRYLVAYDWSDVGKFYFVSLHGCNVTDSLVSLGADWFFVGLARDVLRVVEPEAVAQPEPEPTGAELVGKRCEFWNTPDDHYHLIGECVAAGEAGSYQCKGGVWTGYARLYREGVAP